MTARPESTMLCATAPMVAGVALTGMANFTVRMKGRELHRLCRNAWRIGRSAVHAATLRSLRPNRGAGLAMMTRSRINSAVAREGPTKRTRGRFLFAVGGVALAAVVLAAPARAVPRQGPDPCASYCNRTYSGSAIERNRCYRWCGAHGVTNAFDARHKAKPATETVGPREKQLHR